MSYSVFLLPILIDHTHMLHGDKRVHASHVTECWSHVTTHIEVPEVLIVVKSITHYKLIGDLEPSVCVCVCVCVWGRCEGNYNTITASLQTCGLQGSPPQKDADI